jgi:DNA-binding HxlR family transcriptional regulator
LPPSHRYAQFCPLARATEIVGERWTLLIVRELLIGARRFCDLERPLPGISTSVLAERLARLEERGLVQRRELPPPAGAVVYELTPAGRGLLPAVTELARWGARFLERPREGDHFEPAWVRLALHTLARRGPCPPRRFAVAVPDGDRELVFGAAGGPHGTAVTDEISDPDVSIRAAPLVVLGLAAGGIDPREAVRSGALRAAGDVDALVDFPALFETPNTQGVPR